MLNKLFEFLNLEALAFCQGFLFCCDFIGSASSGVSRYPSRSDSPALENVPLARFRRAELALLDTGRPRSRLTYSRCSRYSSRSDSPGSLKSPTGAFGSCGTRFVEHREPPLWVDLIDVTFEKPLLAECVFEPEFVGSSEGSNGNCSMESFTEFDSEIEIALAGFGCCEGDCGSYLGKKRLVTSRGRGEAGTGRRREGDACSRPWGY